MEEEDVLAAVVVALASAVPRAEMPAAVAKTPTRNASKTLEIAAVRA